MSSKKRVFKLLVSKDVAVSASGLTTTTLPDGGIAAFKNDWTQLGAAETIANSDSIYIVQRVVDSSDTKIGNLNSFEIKGTQVRGYKGEKYRPGSVQISYVGLTPAGTPKTLSTGTGAIVATSSLEFQISVINKAEKEKYQVPRRYNFISDSSATALEIATKGALLINTDPDSIVTAEVIGNGTGTSGLTGATAWGIKIKGKNSDVFFEIGLNDAWDATTITYDVAYYPGTNTVAELKGYEEYSQGYFGYLNRIWLPKTIPSYVVNQANSAIAGPATVAITQNSSRITFNAAVTSDLIAGDEISILGVTYTIATAVSTTVFDLTEPYIAATNAALAIASVTKLEGYDTIVIDHDTLFDRMENDGNATRGEKTIIAIPSFLSNATALSTIQTCLNAYMASTPNRFAGAGL